MISLHLPTSKEFGHNGEGIIKEAFNASVKTQDNGQFELSFNMRISDRLFPLVDNEVLLVADASPYRLRQAFRVYNVSKEIKGVVTVKAQHITYDCLDNHLERLELNDVSCETALNQIFRNSEEDNHFIGTSDIVNKQNYFIEDVSTFEAIKGAKGSIVDTFGNGAKLVRDNFNFGVYQNPGKSKGVLLSYKKNLKELTATYDYQDVVTKIYPSANVTDIEGNSSKITLPEKYLLAPNYDNSKRHKIIPRDFSGEDVTDINSLRIKAQNWFLGGRKDLPKASYKVNFIELSSNDTYDQIKALQEVDIYDEVLVRDFRLGINATARVSITDYDPIRKKYISITVGDIINHQDNSLKDKVTDVEDKVNKLPDNIIVNGDKFPNTVPKKSTISTEGLFSSIMLSWTFENKNYYKYELYGSQTRGFTPGPANLLFSGQASSFLHEVTPHQTWYYRVKGTNTHNVSGEYSDEATATSLKISDSATYFEEAAIKEASIGTLRADRAWVGKFLGEQVDARNLRVIDGNNNETLSVDSFGRVRIKATDIKMIVGGQEEGVVGQSQMTQTVDKFEFNIKSRTGNKIRNSKVFQTSGAYGFGWREIKEGLPSGTYTLTINGSCGNSSGHLEVYAYIGDWEWSVSLGIWTSYNSTNSVTFWLPPEHANKWINIGSYNFPSGSTGEVRTEWYCLTQGDYGTNYWIPHDEEIVDGVTTIDREGWIIQHDSGSYSRANAYEFFQANENGERTLSLRYGGTRFYKWEHDKSYIGSMSATRQSNLDAYGLTIFGTDNSHYVDLGFAESYTGDGQAQGIQSWLRCDRWNNWITAYKPFSNTVRFRSGIRALRSDGVDSWGGLSYMANGSYRYVHAGDQELALGCITSMTDTSWTSEAYMVLKRDADIKLHSYHHWDFHNWTMYNMRTVSALSAQSTYLRARTKDINEVYGVSSFTDGEIRYSDRKEYFTIDDFMLDDNAIIDSGKYTCYIEIPQILAENIQNDYHVNISKLSWGDYRIIEKDPYYFILESEKPNFRFTFEIIAKQIEKPYGFAKIANRQYEVDVSESNSIEDEVITGHSKYAFMDDEEIEIEILKENNELYKLYSRG